ncbi:TIGR03086 family metal-binding protein [Streptomyces sp. NPDC048202]|uniref:TIGR03086 family metal-binding protein n=1 Tax=Streptomyces sp. NPDC048202 TaxID=3365514 RepID=UPI00371F58E0
MSYRFTGIIDRCLLSGSEFTRRLRAVRPEQWTGPTPCAEWDVQRLVNHMTRGNLNYVALLDGGSVAAFLRLRDMDALHGDPVGAYVRSERECAAASRRPGALARILDHPLGPVSGAQALAVRTEDATIHAGDLARAIEAPEDLDPGLVAWIEDHLTDS